MTDRQGLEMRLDYIVQLAYRSYSNGDRDGLQLFKTMCVAVSSKCLKLIYSLMSLDTSFVTYMLQICYIYVFVTFDTYANIIMPEKRF